MVTPDKAQLHIPRRAAVTPGTAPSSKDLLSFSRNSGNNSV